MGRLAACAGGTAAGVGVTVSTGADVRGASEGPMLSTMAGLSVTSCVGHLYLSVRRVHAMPTGREAAQAIRAPA